MTKEEIIKKFPSIFKYGMWGRSGICVGCAYFNTCDKMLPGFINPRKCEGPFYKDKENNTNIIKKYESN